MGDERIFAVIGIGGGLLAWPFVVDSQGLVWMLCCVYGETGPGCGPLSGGARF